MSDSPAKTELRAAIERALVPLGTIVLAWLFGSRATGRARPDSDLDLAVVYRSDLDARGREEARRDLLEALAGALGRLGEQADVVDIARAGSAVGFRAVRDGILVLSRDEKFRVSFLARLYRRYDDDAPRRALYRRAAIEAATRNAP